MADFCRDCSLEMFDKDFRDLACLGDGSKLQPGMGWHCICEGCGFILVDDDGVCIDGRCIRHGWAHIKYADTIPDELAKIEKAFLKKLFDEIMPVPMYIFPYRRLP
jgi:hypothetical protein